jgi:hypothetical protein
MSYGTTLKATWASTGSNSPTISKRQVGNAEVPEGSPEGTVGDPIYKYTLACTFNYWLDEQARKDGKSSLGSWTTSIEYYEVPTGNLYELLYAKFKLSHGYSDPTVVIEGDT